MSTSIENRFKEELFSLLKAYNFKVEFHDGKVRVTPPCNMNRIFIKKIHENTLHRKIKGIKKEEIELLKQYIARPQDIEIMNISPKIVVVGEEYELRTLFKAATIFWEIPVTKGFGRRIRLIVFDENNGKMIGLVGLCDPVFNLRVRDLWIGWDAEKRKKMLWHTMNAYILGAIPPYNILLGGKLVSLACISEDVRRIFTKKYARKKSSVLRIVRKPYLVLITTTTAFGKSIMLDRLHSNGHYYWRFIGYTTGYAPIIFDSNIYELAKKVLSKNKDPELKKYKFGQGPNYRLRIMRKALKYVGLSGDIMNIGVKRGVYVAEMAENAREFLRQEVKVPKFYKNRTLKDLTEYFKERWLIPRMDKLKRKLTTCINHSPEKTIIRRINS